jgi:hypothetical protein
MNERQQDNVFKRPKEIPAPHRGVVSYDYALTFAVSSDRVRISDDVVSQSGEQVGHGAAEFIIDGQERPNDALLAGLVAQARWASARRLETVLKRRNGVVERVSLRCRPTVRH